ncbi:MAG: hypothetical protein SGPRY_012462 [Prymnesium sp.]
MSVTLLMWLVLAPILFAAARLLFALLCCCDCQTARATHPPTAYARRIAWITGASSGIGRELACQLGKLGARLILTARSEQELEQTKALIIAGGGSADDITLLPADMEALDSLPTLVERAVRCFGGVDVLINNAGFSQREVAATTSFGVDVKMASVNYLSCICLAKGVLPTMAARGGGVIINISSLAGKFGVPLRTSYSGTKHALIGFFDALRAEEFARGSGVRVTNVCPGSVRTNVARNAILGSTDSRRGETDPNIEAGLEPRWVCERILSAAYSGVDESWIAKRHELVIAYFSQYLPATFKKTMCKQAAKMIQTTLAPTESK